MRGVVVNQDLGKFRFT